MLNWASRPGRQQRRTGDATSQRQWAAVGKVPMQLSTSRRCPGIEGWPTVVHWPWRAECGPLPHSCHRAGRPPAARPRSWCSSRLGDSSPGTREAAGQQAPTLSVCSSCSVVGNGPRRGQAPPRWVTLLFFFLGSISAQLQVTSNRKCQSLSFQVYLEASPILFHQTYSQESSARIQGQVPRQKHLGGHFPLK